MFLAFHQGEITPRHFEEIGCGFEKFDSFNSTVSAHLGSLQARSHVDAGSTPTLEEVTDVIRRLRDPSAHHPS